MAFGVAGAAGLALAAVVGWWLLAVGAACVAAAWLYTGGPRPYGYVGLGEISVFVFFGLVATTGTAYVQTGDLTALEVLCALPVGLMAVALLVVNNLRDIPGDTVAGKRTVAVRLGPDATRRFYEGCVLLAVLLVVPLAFMRPWALLGLAALPFAIVPVRAVAAGAEGPGWCRSSAPRAGRSSSWDCYWRSAWRSDRSPSTVLTVPALRFSHYGSVITVQALRFGLLQADYGRCDLPGAFEMASVAGARHDRDGSHRADGGGHLVGLVGVAVVELARYQQDGAALSPQFGKPVP